MTSYSAYDNGIHGFAGIIFKRIRRNASLYVKTYVSSHVRLHVETHSRIFAVRKIGRRRDNIGASESNNNGNLPANLPIFARTTSLNST